MVLLLENPLGLGLSTFIGPRCTRTQRTSFSGAKRAPMHIVGLCHDIRLSGR